ncbi:lipopolysaccharide biosynthesis protein [uncultured Enterovirga sp.]|uniref:lipopolysaccharide biosynthesis protein n=1 Tax=uncultured Enterovirga sp. TaxID=2026352 RepID=UPI0035C9B0CD
MSAEPVITPPQALSPQERAQRVSRQLAEAARVLRFTTGGRRGTGDSLRARRGRLLVRVTNVVSFLALVAIPTLASLVYFSFLASDQYVAEARFAVRSGVTAGLDAFTALTGVPSVQIIQDTQVVTNYVESRALLDDLSGKLDLKAIYARPEADYFARLDPEEPIEKIVKYWKKMSYSSIHMPGGIVELQVRAFTPEEAVKVVDAVVAASEKLVNDMNERSRRDAVEQADRELRLAAQRLAAVRAELEIVRNQEGLLDASTEASKAGTVIGNVRTRLLEMQQQYDSVKGTVSPDAPQMRNLRLQIQAAERQLEQLQAELTRSKTAVEGPTLSASMTRLSAANLERQIAESQYGGATAALERARAASLSKQIYLTSFVRPVAAEEARYPRRAWNIGVTFAVGLVSWLILCGLVSLVRNNMA